MKMMKKILASLAAAAIACSAMAVSAFADVSDVTEDGFTAFLMMTDSNWGWGNWGAGNAQDATITTNGTYTVSVNAEDVGADGEGKGFNVFNVDIEGLADAIGAGSAGLDISNEEKMQLAKDMGLTISDVSVIVDGETIYTYDDEDLLYGDIEGNGTLRLELYNAYGATVTEGFAPEDWAEIATTVTYSESVEVEFSIDYEAPKTVSDIDYVVITVEVDEDAVSEAGWIGGAFGVNSTGAGWSQLDSWSIDYENGGIKVDNGGFNMEKLGGGVYEITLDNPFNADDKYGQLWLQNWGPADAVVISSVELFYTDETTEILADEFIINNADSAFVYLVSSDEEEPARFMVEPEEEEPEEIVRTISDVDQIVIYFSIDEDVLNGEDWIGGAFGVNSETLGWSQIDSWTKDYENGGIKVDNDGFELTDLGDGYYTIKLSNPFTADDTYGQVWLQNWGPADALVITSVELIYTDGEIEILSEEFIKNNPDSAFVYLVSSDEEEPARFMVEPKEEEDDPTTNPGTNPSDDPSAAPTDDPTKNPPTGATAGIALAGLALAGAAVVVTKKSK